MKRKRQLAFDELTTILVADRDYDIDDILKIIVRYYKLYSHDLIVEASRRLHDYYYKMVVSNSEYHGHF